MKEQLFDLFLTCDHQVNACMSSVFSKDDVKAIYNGLLPEILQIIEKNTIVQFPKINEQMLTDLQVLIRDNFEYQLDRAPEDCVDYDSAEFEIGYNNRVELTSVCLNHTGIAELLDGAMLEAFEKTFNIETNESE